MSVNIIDQCVAQGVPFAREYGGLLDNRSFGGAQVSRTFYARGQTGQQLLLGAYSALCKEIAAGSVQSFTHAEMLDLVVVDGHAKGIIARNLVTGEISRHAADAVVLATGGYGNVFNLSTYARNSNATAIWRAYKRGACFANPCYTQIHPTCIPVSGDYQSKLTLMSESLRNDGRIWVPKKKEDCGKPPGDIPEEDRDYYLERKYPSFGNLAPRDISCRAAKQVCDEGRGVGESGLGVYLDFADAIQRLGEDKVRERYGNLFDIYHEITNENAYQVPMRIYPAVHYTMGGLWVDYNLMSNLPGPVRARRGQLLRPRRQPPRRQRADAGPGRWLLRHSLHHLQLPRHGEARQAPEHRPRRLQGRRKTVSGHHPASAGHQGQAHGGFLPQGTGQDHVGTLRHGAQRGRPQEGAATHPALREEFWKNVNVPGEEGNLNQALERAGRVADFIELAELMCLDALERAESCGGHFREEHQYPDGEAKRDDNQFAHVAAWEYQGEGQRPIRHVEPLEYQEVKMVTRSYK